ncbi:hypothetical protein [Brachybacterium kimchii]|uniref:Uncharacterized protein n=1 Tax=Brachybacterium kimchii TaxID=2942909 RepID=A0ABY4N7R9_9MICO|nr:hypothetical protein [Brachybacterium kimchii]UQN29468.1 hypothetical protein M4486_17815 [Brachybacterium kimchii]
MHTIRRIAATAAVLTATAALAACGGEEPYDHLGVSEDYQQKITDAGAECDWETNSDGDYTGSVCNVDGDAQLVMVVAGDSDVLKEQGDELKDAMEHGIAAEGDDFVAVTTDLDMSATVDKALGSDSKKF